MLRDKLTLIPSYLYYLWVKYQEKKIGYRLVLPEFTSHWINGTFIFDMNPVWKKYGQPAVGVNYFTIGGVKNGQSSRYDPQSDYYQSWLGGYIVKFPYARDWTIPEHYQLAEADQKGWLVTMGDTLPLMSTDKKSICLMGKVNICGFPAKIVQAAGWSHSDLGSGPQNLTLKFLMSGMAHIFNFSNSELALTGSDMLPVWSEKYKIKSYEKLYLTGYFFIVDITPQIKAIFYGNGTQKTLSKIKKELLGTMQSFRIIKV
jgi:hypothetical protein